MPIEQQTNMICTWNYIVEEQRFTINDNETVFDIKLIRNETREKIWGGFRNSIVHGDRDTVAFIGHYKSVMQHIFPNAEHKISVCDIELQALDYFWEWNPEYGARINHRDYNNELLVASYESNGIKYFIITEPGSSSYNVSVSGKDLNHNISERYYGFKSLTHAYKFAENIDSLKFKHIILPYLEYSRWATNNLDVLKNLSSLCNVIDFDKEYDHRTDRTRKYWIIFRSGDVKGKIDDDGKNISINIVAYNNDKVKIVYNGCTVDDLIFSLENYTEGIVLPTISELDKRPTCEWNG